MLSEVLVRSLHLTPEIHRLRTGIEKTAYKLSDNRILGYELRQNYRDEHPDLRETFPYINADGQRDIERQRAKKSGTIRILLLGDSVVIGDGVFDLNDTISRQLEKSFASHQPPIEVLNFGVSGYCTRGEVELLKTKGVFYSPDIVLMLFVYNDYDNYNGKINPYAFSRPRWANELFVRSALFRYVCLTFDAFHFRQQTDPLYMTRWHGGAVGKNSAASGISLFRELSERWKFQPMIILWPMFENKKIGYVPFGGSNVDQQDSQLPIEKMAELTSIATARIDGNFRSDYSSRITKATPRALYTIGDGIHPSVEGAKVAALAIKRILEERRMVGR